VRELSQKSLERNEKMAHHLQQQKEREREVRIGYCLALEAMATGCPSLTKA